MNTGSEHSSRAIEIGLNAAMVAMIEGNPAILTVLQKPRDSNHALPYGQFDPSAHRTMEMGLRELVEDQTGIRPGYIEQLYTFGDRGRHFNSRDGSPHVVSVGYLALGRINQSNVGSTKMSENPWKSWYDFFPWEDWRQGRPEIIDNLIIPSLESWAVDPETENRTIRGLDPISRVRLFFGLGDATWDDEQVLDRYELMYSAGLLHESVVDGRIAKTIVNAQLGQSMIHDHRRILATAIARLRGKLKYRPVIFELMSDNFTLFDLQQTVESIFGRSVHKQNFRRLVEKANLVEPTGASEHSTGGRPAALFRFRREILRERPAPGLRVGRG